MNTRCFYKHCIFPTQPKWAYPKSGTRDTGLLVGPETQLVGETWYTRSGSLKGVIREPRPGMLYYMRHKTRTLKEAQDTEREIWDTYEGETETQNKHLLSNLGHKTMNLIKCFINKI